MGGTFECPNCRGALEADGSARTVVCSFCGSKVIVPRELRDEEKPSQMGTPPQVMIGFSPTIESTAPVISTRGRSGGGSVLVSLFVLAIFCVVGVIILVSVLAPLGLTMGFLQGFMDPFNLGQGSGSGGPGLASPVLTFGSSGSGPGLFDDVRYVAADSQGNIYTGNYSDGRIQRFDAEGNFLSLFMIDSGKPLRGLAVDRGGIVYAVQGGDILRYEGETGTPLGPLSYDEGWGFDDVTLTADGGLVAAWYRNRDDIVRFDAAGSINLVISGAISGASGRSELNTRVAVDGLGNIYALGTFNDGVFKFSPDGRFLTRFGGDGDEPGQFRAPLAIAVDGQSRIYVSDFKGIQVFDSEGRYLGVIPVDGGPAYGLHITAGNDLFVAAGDRVIQYALTAP